MVPLASRFNVSLIQFLYLLLEFSIGGVEFTCSIAIFALLEH